MADRPHDVDPDRFERMLARSLPRQSQSDERCPDPEEIAAFSEHSLTASEYEAVEAHVSTCATCQAHLVALVRTTDVGRESAAATGSVPTAWWLDWRWLAPLASAAVVLLAVWAIEPSSVTEPSAPMFSDSDAQSAAVAEEATLGSVARETVTPEVVGPQEAEPAPPPLEENRQRQETVARNETAAPLEQPEREATPAEAEVALDEAVATVTQSPGISADTTRDRIDTPGAGTTPSDTAERAAATQTFAARASAARGNIALDQTDGPVVFAPGRRVVWRVTSDGTIDRSIDGGDTWIQQLATTDAELTGGSATSESVCWLVGRSGTILRTVDGGTTWVSVEAPVPIDIANVTARDENSLTLELIDGRRFTSRDGGSTWTAE